MAHDYRTLDYQVLDVETTFVKNEDKSTDNRPYNPENKLVSLGLKGKGIECHYYMINHETMSDKVQYTKEIQNTLDNCTLLVGHNIKFDLSWIRECGYVYEGLIWDTMLVEKVLSGGKLKANELGLSTCCVRRGLPVKTDLVADYWQRGVPTDEIPWGILESYGINDIVITEQLFIKQLKEIYND